MSSQAALARRYRTLLRWYPAEYRKTYGEEMIGVLLAAASDDQQWPSLADAGDLMLGAVRARFRSAVTAGAAPGWRDALALFSLVAPLVAVVAAVACSPSLLWGFELLGYPDRVPVLQHLLTNHRSLLLAALIALPEIAVLVAPLILSLFRLRRTAALAAAGLLIWTIMLIWIPPPAAMSTWAFAPANAAVYQIFLVMQAVALLTSAGPRRGWQLITRRGLLISGLWLAAGILSVLHAAHVAAISSILVNASFIALLLSLASAKARRLLMLLAIPSSAFLLSLFRAVRWPRA